MPDSRFEEFLVEASTATWPSAEAVQGRGQRRRLRQRWAAIGAAVAVAAVVLAGLTLRGTGAIDVAPVPPASVPPVSVDTTPSPAGSAGERSGSPSGSPSGSGSGRPSGSSAGSAGSATATGPGQPPAARMLLPADLGGSWTAARDEGGDWTLAAVINHCEPVGADPVRPLDSTSQILRGEGYVRQFVHRYPHASGAAAKTADIRSRVERCASFRSRYDGDRYTLRVLSPGFAAGADESFVVEKAGEGWTAHAVFVRRGAFVTEVVVSPNDDANRRRVGQAAADRLAGT